MSIYAKESKYQRKYCCMYLNLKHWTFLWAFNWSPIHPFDCIVQFLCGKSKQCHKDENIRACTTEHKREVGMLAGIK